MGRPPEPPKGWVFYDRRAFFWKVVLLVVTTVAFVPILLYRNVEAGIVALLLLVAAHVAGAIVILVGVRRQQIAPDRRGMWIRITGIVILLALVWLAARGLSNPLSSTVFWLALFAIWALHTLGLALLHVRTRREQSVCPFA